jgi:hypothetical protein
MGQHDDVQAPFGSQVFKIEVAPEPAAGYECDIRMVEALVDLLVLILALFDVPSRQSVLDFAEGPEVLLEDDDQRTASRRRSDWW